MKKILFRKLLLDYMSFFLIALLSSSIIIWVFQAVNFLDIMIEDGRDYIVRKLPDAVDAANKLAEINSKVQRLINSLDGFKEGTDKFGINTSSPTRVVEINGVDSSNGGSLRLTYDAATGNATKWGNTTVDVHSTAGLSNGHGGLG